MKRNLLSGVNNTLNRVLWWLGNWLPLRQGKGPILVVRPDLIGDFLLFTPALAPMRRNYAGRKIILVVQRPVAALLEGCPYVDRVVALEERRFRRNPFYRLAFLWRITRMRSTTALYPCYSRNSVGDAIMLWSAAHERIGWDNDEHHLSLLEKSRGDRLYSKLIVGCVSPDMHEIERTRLFLLELGSPMSSNATEVWFLPTADSRAHVPKQSGDCDTLTIALLPGASFPIKKWGADCYNQLMHDLATHLNGRPVEFVICGQRGDADNIVTEVGLSAKVVDLTGKTTLAELGTLFTRCSVVIGNDTGTMHLAIATGVPTVCILGGGHYGRFMPYGNPARNAFLSHPLPCYQCGWNCVLDEPACISRVTVARVVDSCTRWI